MQKAFSGPLELRERLGSIDAATLAAADLEPVLRVRAAIHRFPGPMAQRVHALAVHVRDEYDGDAARVWTDAPDGAALRANLAALPGFGEIEDQGARRGAGQALRRRGRARTACRRTRRSATSTRRRRWPTTGGQARPQGRVDRGRASARPGYTRASGSARSKANLSFASSVPASG